MCLTVRQPWAWALTAGVKDVENRGWRTAHRGLLVIHAGAKVDPAGYLFCRRLGLTVPDDVALGAAVGTVELDGCVWDSRSPWAMKDHWNWLVTWSASFSDPVPMRGMPGLFRAPAVLADRITDASRQAQQLMTDHHPGP